MKKIIPFLINNGTGGSANGTQEGDSITVFDTIQSLCDSIPNALTKKSTSNYAY